MVIDFKVKKEEQLKKMEEFHEMKKAGNLRRNKEVNANICM
jgi:DNA polymerase/3'-5' exonuclease PolX